MDVERITLISVCIFDVQKRTVVHTSETVKIVDSSNSTHEGAFRVSILSLINAQMKKKLGAALGH